MQGSITDVLWFVEVHHLRALNPQCLNSRVMFSSKV